MPASKLTQQHAPVLGKAFVKLEFINGYVLNMTCAQGKNGAQPSTELNAVNSDSVVGVDLPGEWGHLTVNSSSFKLALFNHNAPSHAKKAVCVGDVVRMFHATHEGFLSATGSSADKKVVVHQVCALGPRSPSYTALSCRGGAHTPALFALAHEMWRGGATAVHPFVPPVQQ